MNKTDRRAFLKLMGTPALAAGLPVQLARALEIPAHNRTRSIADVEHIVILTQENRSFDHYFGTMRGVRGFADPRAVRLPSGRPVWEQPSGSGSLLPFRPNVDNLGATFLPDPPHGWNDSHAAWNGGRYDRWVPNKGVTTMTHHTRRDLPYHFALADAFTVCDAYHCSVMGPTDPNRYHMWSGWVGNDGAGGGPVITNAEAGYDWSTYPERLQRAGISWKVYQDVGTGLDAAGFWGWTDDPFIGNYGDNSLLYFHQYQFALTGTPLADRARTGTSLQAHNRDPKKLVEIFREDVRRGRLPKVSWIAAPEAYSEHPNWAPNYGAWYISQFVDALASNPEVFSKTVLFINYDEEGGFFDHMVPPTPPQSPAHGLSTVATTNEIFPGDSGHPSAPYGLGVRVPMIVVSPWSKGGWVNSQVFDSTSLIRFIEARFAEDAPDLIETNITPWRRAVAGDLTSAFDFKTPNASKTIVLPGTEAFEPRDLVRQPDEVPVPPATQRMPSQEPGVRPARALPYVLDAHASRAADGSVRLDFRNLGEAAVVFQMRSGRAADLPKTYTVGPDRHLSDTWNAAGASQYDLGVYGPNGFFRGFRGAAGGGANLDVRAAYDENGTHLTLSISNLTSHAATVNVQDQYRRKSKKLELGAGESTSERWSLARMSGWYDLVITVAGDAGFERRVAGHVENGEDSISDPAMGGLV
jgi:phospholipase C